MRVLLDESLPRRLKLFLEDHAVVTVAEAGWKGKTNGDLLALASRDFDVFVTVDRAVALSARGPLRLAIIVLLAQSNRLEHLRPLVPAVLSALHEIRPGAVVTVGPQ